MQHASVSVAVCPPPSVRRVCKLVMSGALLLKPKFAEQAELCTVASFSSVVALYFALLCCRCCSQRSAFNSYRVLSIHALTNARTHGEGIKRNSI